MDDAPDLDLLRVFDALYRHRHLTRAASRLGRSQPAVSRALARLRALFDDPLFVRVAGGMAPTPRADALAPEVHALLERARALIAPSRFDPRTLRRTFSICATDFVEQYLVDGVVRELSSAAPRVDLTFRPVPPDLAEALATDVDLAVGVRGQAPPGCVVQHLFDDGFVCAARADHPRVRRRLTLERFLAEPHVQIAPGGRPGGPVDDALAAHGLARRVAVRTPSFLTAPLLVSRSDLLLCGPSRMLRPLAKVFGLRVFALPLEVPGFRVHHCWHPRVHDDPAHRFFRERVAKVARAASGPPERTASHAGGS